MPEMPPGSPTGVPSEGYTAASTTPIPHVVVVGAAARDLVADDPRGWRMGGGATYAGLAFARLGLRTAVLLGADPTAAADGAEIDRIREAGADVRLVDLDRGPIFENIERPEGRLQICGQPSDRVSVPALPAEWLAAPGWLFAPVADEVGDEWATVPPADAVVGLGWQGLLRILEPGRPVRHRAPRPSRLVVRADLVGLSHHDVDPGTTIDALLGMLRPRARLLMTDGAAGGIVWQRSPDGRPRGRSYPAIAPERVVDPTGAGDTFLAAYFATLLTVDFTPMRRRGGDLRFAAAAGSLAVEDRGLAGVPDLAAVIRRARRG